MIPLNDDELNALLQQAKAKPPHAPRELAARTMRAYQAAVNRPVIGRKPLVFVALAAALLILIGALGDRVLRAPSVVVRIRSVEVPVVRERIVYRDCLAEPPAATSQIDTLTFREMRPVRQIRPRVVRSIRDDQ
jgi:hypothetical protein